MSFEINAKETQGFNLKRPSGKGSYVFLRFRTPVFLQDKDSYSLHTPGSCILYTPTGKQTFFSPDCDFIHDYVTFDISQLNFFDMIDFPLNKVLYPQNISLVDETFQIIKNEQMFPAPAQKEMINLSLTKMFIVLAREQHLYDTYSDTDIMPKESFVALRNDVYKHPQDYNVSLMAEKLHFSLTHFSAQYKLIFKISPIKDLTKAKLETVLSLLQKKMPPNEVATALNFDSLANFYKWFKKNTGYTPKTYTEKIHSLYNQNT